MRLLRLQYNGDYELVRYVGKHVPPYAILSHTWGRDDEEVAFSDIQNATYRNKPAFAKLQFCGEQAAKDNLEHFWVDTCCINKSSDAELSEALNSMFRWYRNATKCYVYLADVAVNRDSQQLPLELMDPESHQLPFESTFRQSRWFTRGWTLQELVAPSSVDFFSCEGIYIGNKRTLELPIYNITGIAIAALRGASLSNFSVAERISWAARRETTIEEDQVYCLLGIFDVHMPVIYGERVEHAMRRLRKEILETDRTSTLKEVYESDNPEACLSTLAAADQTRFLSQTLHRSKHACVWISSNRQYDVWYKDNDSSLLWITARAGCGKTTAAAHISQMVSAEQIKGQGSIEKAYKPVLLYFFFRRSNLKADKTALAALRTLTSQLVHQEARLLPILHRRHDELSAKGGFEWTWENLSSVLEEMLEQPMFTLPVYIVLDAIDECESDSRKLILDWAKGLVGAMTTSTFRAPNTIIKLLVTSRPDGDIIDQLYGFPMLEMTDTETASDMRALIHGRMEQFSRRRHLAPEVADNIVRFLETNARGMFLWVVLIFEELERRDERLSNEVIASRLSRIPLTLIGTYEAILRNVPQNRQADMWRIIRWLLYASRSLTVAELEAGLALETAVSSWHGFAGDLDFLCGSLIRFDGPREEINLVHQTARSFLQAFIQKSTPADVAGLGMSMHAADEHLATICVEYLLKEDILMELSRLGEFLVKSDIHSHMVERLLRQHTFLHYAIGSWAFHVQALGSPSSALVTRIHVLLSSWAYTAGIMLLTYVINNKLPVPIPKTPLHFAAYFNLHFLVDSYIVQDRTMVNAVNDMHDTPLIWASEMGNTACVKKLLDVGADPNKFEYDGWSALHWAARKGHVDVATLLLDHGARIDPLDSGGHTPLDWAIDRGYWGAVDVLKQRMRKGLNQGITGASSQDRDGVGGTIDTRVARSRRAWKLWDMRP